MGDSTSERPKCLSALAGRTLLNWQLAALASAGITSVTVIRGYRSDLLVSPEYAALDNADWARTNMVATLRCGAALLRRAPCVIAYGDIVYRPDHVRAVAADDHDIVIAYDVLWASLWSARFENPLADAETFSEAGGWLTAIGDKTASTNDIHGQYLGLLKVSPEGWARIEAFVSGLSGEDQARIDVTSLLRGLLSTGVRVRCVPVHGGWCEVDSESDVRLYESRLQQSEASGTVWDHDWRWEVASG